MGVDIISQSLIIHPKKKNLPYRTLINYTLSTIPELRNNRNRIAAGRAGKGPARTRAGIKHPLLHPVDRDPEFGNISRYAGIGHDLKRDR